MRSLLLGLALCVHLASAAICTIVRTYSGQKSQLPVLLMSLSEAARIANVSLIFYILDTDPTREPSRYIQRAILMSETYFPASRYEHVILPNFKPTKATYGFEDTDLLLAQVLTSSKETDKSCAYFLVTNGDNFYTPFVFKSLKEYFATKVDVITAKFVHRTKLVNTVFARGVIDLGAVFMSRRAIVETKVKFLPNGYKTSDLFARDWFFFNAILRSPQNYTRSIGKDIIFVHS
jgi:hypothetical protein